jgi:hypothetical protein
MIGPIRYWGIILVDWVWNALSRLKDCSRANWAHAQFLGEYEDDTYISLPYSDDGDSDDEDDDEQDVDTETDKLTENNAETTVNSEQNVETTVNSEQNVETTVNSEANVQDVKTLKILDKAMTKKVECKE